MTKPCSYKALTRASKSSIQLDTTQDIRRDTKSMGNDNRLVSEQQVHSGSCSFEHSFIDGQSPASTNLPANCTKDSDHNTYHLPIVVEESIDDH